MSSSSTSASSLVPMLPLLASGLWTGASLYVIVAEHPGRMALGPDLAVRQFVPSFKRAAFMQVSLIALTALPAAYNYYKTSNKLDLYTAVTMASVLPYTIAILGPINDQLLDTTAKLTSDDKASLLQGWITRHTVRTVIGTAAFALAALKVASEKSHTL